MHADRVQILHGTDNDAVILVIPDDFQLDFLPACDGLLHQNLSDGTLLDAHLAVLHQFLFIGGNAAAGAPQGVCRADDHRVADSVHDLQTFFHTGGDVTGRDRLMDLFHQRLEGFPVLGLVDTFLVHSQKFHAVFLEYALLIQGHADIQARLSAETGQNAVRTFLLDDLRHRLFRDRLQVNPVRNPVVCHDGGRITVHQDGLDPFFGDGLAGLGAGVVELSSLADDDRTGSDDHYLLQSEISWHYSLPPSIRSMNLSNR